ncbi:single-stranded DNA-binding protein [Fowl aviadenovirus E]|uniref:DNA-binding protein n=1 Tax=Fowl aviadenovirus E TaxID=190065 RepID=A0A650BZS9_9ADEN|nr:single-stranded DNA-binding protein [Fowl aviadenovirus E]QGQ62808.1 single-stranded DNA-binding protein [Fowl aviadenovirus E]QGQ62913.1 DNA-binding protein [Fowl aviadenovirus E]
MSAAAGREEEWDASSDGEDQQAPKRRTREKTPMPGSDDSESDWRQRPKSPTSTARRGQPSRVQKRRLEIEEVFSSSEESSPGDGEEERGGATVAMVKDSNAKSTKRAVAEMDDEDLDVQAAETAPKGGKKKGPKGAPSAAAAKKPRKEKRPTVAVNDTDEEEDEDALAAAEEAEMAAPRRKKASAAPLRSDDEDEDEEGIEKPLNDPVEFGAQKAMKFLTTLCDRLDLRWQGCTIRPDDAIWTKLGGTFVRKRHPEFRLTFSSFDSFHNQVGRFVAAMVYGMADLEPKFIPGGAHVWRHGWEFGTCMPKCLHGSAMFTKPRTVELNPTSEAGKRAIAEQNGQVEKNRFGKQVVVLRFERNAVCAKDAEHSGFPYPHAIGSCGMVFSDAAKAVSAMRHDLEWTKALYPNAEKRRAEEHILISTNCNCNYAAQSPISGRQVCRMTPYKLSGTDDIASDTARARADMKAHKKYPHTMVFTCCNPQSPSATDGSNGRSGRRNTDKTCAWRLSSMDLRHAYVFATELVVSATGVQAPTHVPEFRWHDRFGFKTEVIAPVQPLDAGDPFA